VFATNDEYFIGIFIKAGVDGIITDYPDKALKLRASIAGW